jgi:hypothetical protein
MPRPRKPSKRTWDWSLSIGQIAWQLILSALISSISLLAMPRTDTLEATIFALEPIDYHTLGSAALSDSDEDFALIATISPNNVSTMQGFVAYQSQRSEIDIRDQQIWVFESSNSPALNLDMQGGSFQILPDYQFGGTLHTSESPNKRFQGLQVGDEVLVYGKLFSSRDRIIVEASYLFAGDYSDLRAKSIHNPQIMRNGIALLIGCVTFFILWQKGHRPLGTSRSSPNKQARKSP